MASEHLAVLFADVCDSTTVYESLGDAQALAAITRLFGVLGAKVRAYNGTIVKTLGDGMVCQFDAADRACRAACELQEVAANADSAEGPKLTIKVTFNWGPVVTEGDDVFGDTVNVCARLVGLAGPQQILTTQETVDALASQLRANSRPLYPIQIRGRSEAVKVCEVLWRSDPDVTAAFSRSQISAAAREWILKLTYGDEHVWVQANGSIRLGRDKANDLVVTSSKASRVHARIYGRGANFVIADQSSNGTFVATDGSSREVTLHREEAVLGESGYIGLGGPASSPGEHVLRYRLERRKT